MADLTVIAPTPGRVIADTVIRAVKTAISTFLGILGANVAGWTNVSGIRNAGIVALAAGASGLVNLLLAWANSPTG